MALWIKQQCSRCVVSATLLFSILLAIASREWLNQWTFLYLNALCSSSNSTEAGNIGSSPMQRAQIAMESAANHQSAG